MKKYDFRISIYGIFILASWIILPSCQERFGLNPIRVLTDENLAIDKSEVYLLQAKEKNKEYYRQFLLVKKSRGWKEFETSDLKKIIPLHTTDLTICLLLLEYYLHLHDFTMASLLAEQAEALGARSAEYFINKATLYTALHQYDRAIDNINKALLLNPSDFSIYLQKGNIYLSYGDTTSAIHFIGESFANNQRESGILYQLSSLYALTHQAQKAQSLIDEALLSNPSNVRMLAVKAELQEAQNDFAGAMDTYRELLALQKPGAGLALAKIYFQQQIYDSAIYYADKTLAMDTVSLDALLIKANAFDQKGYFSSALLNYEQILTIDSTHQQAIEGVKKVDRKIAYLRKSREARAAIPRFDFAAPAKKKTIN